jgi:hypothetical protein
MDNQSIEAIQSRLEFFEEKIENIQHSGHFTDFEIERELPGLKKQVSFLKSHADLLNKFKKTICSKNDFLDTAEN